MPSFPSICNLISGKLKLLLEIEMDFQHSLLDGARLQIIRFIENLIILLDLQCELCEINIDVQGQKQSLGNGAVPSFLKVYTPSRVGCTESSFIL